jgi:hypothetical protein
MSFQEDRRDAKSQRIPFEAIVELGGEVDPNSAFEAQGVNVSATGMHLRTAYLPEVGQPLLCRFGSGAQEISAEADVVWRREGPRGGEFGIRFTNLDGASAAALWEMCGMNRGEPTEAAAPSRPETDAGTRVRLHIDGLGSPMKARVRGATDAELLVGSNLEFLRVGRQLELEDVDHGGKRPAHIDRVDVEIDRTSKVPQLVVTLRYDDVSPEAAPVRMTSEQVAAVSNASANEPMVQAEPSEPAPPAAVASHQEPAVDSSDEVEAAKMMRSKFSSAAADIMPKVSEFGARAKTTMGLLLAKAMEKTKGREPAAPRRTTSPPPSGALHASGKRVVRDGEDADHEPRETPKRKIGKKGMVALGGTAGLLTVVAAMALHKSSSPPPGAATAELTAAVNANEMVADPATDKGAVQANVPLYGATTLSTTEPVAAAPPSAFGTPNAGANPSFGLPGGAMASSSMEAVDDRKGSSDDDGDKAHSKVAPFGHGKVSHAIHLRMKTDGDITAIHGARTPTGFTVTIPGRRSMDSGSTLAGKDPRIASIHVNNGSKGSELAFQFKDGVPPYLVRAKGHDLQISLGRSNDSDDGKDAPTHGTTAKKRPIETNHRSKRD